MLRKLLWGSVLEGELSGVDDPVVRASIRRSCLWRSNTLAPALALALVMAVCAGIIVELLGGTIRLVGWLHTALWVVGGWLVVRVFSLYWKRRVTKILPEVLRSMERCTRCGYKLNAGIADRCPECGCIM